jgi:hypothetical protein
LGPGVLVEVEQGGHGAGELRFRGKMLDGFGIDIQRLEKGLVEELGQGFVRAALAEAGHELLGILLEIAKSLPEERKGHHPLSLFDQIQIGGRDAQVSRRIGLLDIAR